MTLILTSEVRCEDPAHRSYSTDGDWDECQFKWMAKSLLKVPNPMPAKVAVGSAVDEIVKQRLLGRNPDTATVLDAQFHRCLTPMGDLPEAIVKTDALLALWEAEVRPLWEEVGVYAVEWELHFDVHGVPYHVHIDVVLKDGTIIDLKTGDQRLGLDRAMYDIQLTTYAAALWLEFEQIAPRVILDGLIYAQMPKDEAILRGLDARDGHRPKPWFERQVSNRTVEQIESWMSSAARRSHAVAFAGTTGEYQTQGRSSMFACSGCPARSICPEWSGWEGLFGEVKEVTSAA